MSYPPGTRPSILRPRPSSDRNAAPPPPSAQCLPALAIRTAQPPATPPRQRRRHHARTPWTASATPAGRARPVYLLPYTLTPLLVPRPASRKCRCFTKLFATRRHGRQPGPSPHRRVLSDVRDVVALPVSASREENGPPGPAGEPAGRTDQVAAPRRRGQRAVTDLIAAARNVA
jgi:hypothetical protein